MDSTGTVTTVEPLVQAHGRGKGNKGISKGNGKGLDTAGTNEEDETEDTADHQEKGESEHQSEGTAGDAWCLGSMGALGSASATTCCDEQVCSSGRARQYRKLPRTRAGSKGTRR